MTLISKARRLLLWTLGAAMIGAGRSTLPAAIRVPEPMNVVRDAPRQGFATASPGFRRNGCRREAHLWNGNNCVRCSARRPA